MRFALGSTRFVILTDKYAIKFARLRPVRPLLQLLRHSLSGKTKAKLQKFHKNPLLGGLWYITAGIHANRAEWKIYREYASDILVPTLWTFYGIVNVQVRGGKVSQQEVQMHYLHEALTTLPIADNDVFEAKQFCKIGDKVVLADYGRLDLIPVLSLYCLQKSSA